MTRLTQLCATTALAALITGTPALADITAKEAWDGWHDQLTGSGYDVSFDEAASDGILTINNLIISKELDEEAGQSSLSFGPIGYHERGDGSVEVILASDTPVTFTPSSDFSFTFMLHQTGLSFVLSGAPDEMTREIHADALVLNLIEMVENGAVVRDAKVDLVINDLSGTLLTRTKSPIEVVSDFSIASITYDLDMKERVDSNKAYVWTGSLTNLHGATDIALPDNYETATLSEVIEAGMRFKLSGGYDALVNKLTFDGEGNSADISLSSNNGSLDVEVGEITNGLINVAQNLSLGGFSFDFDVVDEDRNLDLELQASLTDVSGGFKIDIPENFDPEQMPAALEAGLTFAANLNYGVISTIFASTQDGQTTFGNASAASGKGHVSMDRKTLRYSGSVSDEKISMENPALPIGPIEYSLANAAFEVVMPVGKSTEPEAFTFKFRLADIWISENLWSIFDSTTALPHDPATIELDISGMGNWLVDIMDIKSEATQSTEVKGELHALTLNKLQVTGGGADLNGTGDFTFNNDDLTSFKGMPAPTGTMNLKLTGGNTLIDTLIELGVLPTDDAMGIRMALGLIAVAGDGEDTLISDIEITDDGHILANGQRLK